MADLPNVPRTIHGEREMTYRIPPWLPAKLRRWDRGRDRFVVHCWTAALVTGVFTLASWLAGYGDQYQDYPGWTAFWAVITVALVGWPLYRSARLHAARVGMGGRMAQLVDIGSLSWTRLPTPERDDAEGVIRELFRAANRHDVMAAKYRVDMLARLERTCVVSARQVAGDVADLEDVEKTVVGREAINGVD